MSENNNENSNGSAKPKITINIPIKTTEEKILEVLKVLDIDAPLPPMEQVHQINLQMEVKK